MKKDMQFNFVKEKTLKLTISKVFKLVENKIKFSNFPLALNYIILVDAKQYRVFEGIGLI